MTAEILNTLDTIQEKTPKEIAREIEGDNEIILGRLDELERSGMIRKKGIGYVLTQRGVQNSPAAYTIGME